MKFVLAGLFALAAPLALAGQAPEFPTKPVRVIVPWPPGGSTDTIARIVGQRYSSVAGQPVVIDNRAGASGTIGVDIASRATPDGYTITIAEGSHAVMPATVKLPYDLVRDFAPVTMIGRSPMIFFMHNGVAAKTVQELVALARAKPGAMLMAHTGIASFTHLLTELFQQRTNTRFTMVGYKGAAPALIELAGGQVHVYPATLASGAPTLKTGRVVAIAIAGDRRVDALPGVPTLAEAGFPNVSVYQWWGFIAPVKVPAAVIGKLNKDLVTSIDHASVRERVAELAVDVETSTPAQLGTAIRTELARWVETAKAAGIKAE